MNAAQRKEYLDARAAKAAQMTTWHNPWKVPQRISLILSGDTPSVIIWKPGERKEISSIHDEAIQRVQNGVIVGGQAPCLVNETADPRPILHGEHESANRHLLLVPNPKDPDAELERATAPDPKPPKK